MRIVGRIVLLVTVFIMLQACASTRVAQQLQSGKISFEDGNYKSAFHKLLPLASEGNAAAEYAVGYMYYYGYGTTQDAESGLFWMNKAAEQKYDPAIKALLLIKENKMSPEPIQQLSAERSEKEETDAVMRALAANKSSTPASLSEKDDADALAAALPPAQPESVDVQPGSSRLLASASKANETLGFDSAKPLAATKAPADFNLERSKKYTLQLAGSYQLADLKRVQHQLHIENNSYCARTSRNGRDWYVLGYGHYSAPYLAKLALDDLPQTVRGMKPWVRELNDANLVA